MSISLHGFHIRVPIDIRVSDDSGQFFSRRCGEFHIQDSLWYRIQFWYCAHITVPHALLHLKPNCIIKSPYCICSLKCNTFEYCIQILLYIMYTLPLRFYLFSVYWKIIVSPQYVFFVRSNIHKTRDNYKKSLVLHPIFGKPSNKGG